ncbi:unnamed protein product [Brassica rapa]|uniref:Uncharacterized protein n=1 Tax=Brassica campestris TaxID=3711 RepID=A0A3P5ZL77_BRACM|nr:unnamed protein product [Brassica rapa]CAG7878372.1 unnamed protein product [Brassica rapa]VDC73300.1 unnamed protein product [Brassica rapa]
MKKLKRTVSAASPSVSLATGEIAGVHERRRDRQSGEVIRIQSRGGGSKFRRSSFARTVNLCDVMLGVHGAELTNMVFATQCKDFREFYLSELRPF